jgi:hypothetical protein
VGGVNRVGTEFDSTYYGAACSSTSIGQIVAQAGEKDDEVL